MCYGAPYADEGKVGSRHMNSRTHMLVGAAASLALLEPTGASACLIDVAGGLLGGWICDIDVSSKSAVKDYFFGVDILVPLVAIALIDHFLDLGVAGLVLNRMGPVATVGAAAFVVLAVLGSQWKRLCHHRTFMHSFLAVVLFSAPLWLVFPQVVPPFAIGMLLHVALDVTNKKGVQVLFPLSPRFCLRLFRSDGRVDKGLRLVALVALGVLLCRLGIA